MKVVSLMRLGLILETKSGLSIIDYDRRKVQSPMKRPYSSTCVVRCTFVGLNLLAAKVAVEHVQLWYPNFAMKR